MDNNINNNKLDEIVKKTLSSYEAVFDAVDWAQMESMLDVAPKQNSINKSNYPAIVISVVVLVAGFLLYGVLKPSRTPEKTEETNQAIEIKQPIVPKLKPVETHSIIANADSAAKEKISEPIAKKDSIISKEKLPVSAVKKDVKPIEKKGSTLTEKSAKQLTPGKSEKTETDSKTTEKSEEALKKEKALKKEALIKKEEALKKEKALKKEAQLKKEKALKKEIKPEIKGLGNDTVHIEDENDSNRKKETPKVDTSSGNKNDTLKGTKEKKTKEIKKSKKEKKPTIKMVNPELVKKDPESKKDTIIKSN